MAQFQHQILLQIQEDPDSKRAPIYLMNLDGSNRQKVVETIHPGSFCTTPEGKIAFVDSEDEVDNLYLIEQDGSGKYRLTDNRSKTLIMRVAWAPDGSQILFVSHDDARNNQIFSMNTDGTNIRQLTFGNDNDCPCWSPDAQQIVYSRGVAQRQIYLMDADGGNQRPLTTIPQLLNTGVDSPTWSPNGKYIAFKVEKVGIGILYSNGENLRFLSTNRDDCFRGSPAWSPDSSKIAFIQGDPFMFIRGRPQEGVFHLDVGGRSVRKYIYNSRAHRDPVRGCVWNLCWLPQRDSGQPTVDVEIPEVFIPHAEIALQHIEQDEYEKAVVEFQRALQMTPEDPEILSELAFTYMALGKAEEAIESGQRGLSLNPTPYRQMRARMARAGSFYQLDQFEQSLSEWNECLKLVEQWPDSRVEFIAQKGIGLVYAQQRKLQQAVEHFEKAHELRPEDGDIQQRLETGRRLLRLEQQPGRTSADQSSTSSTQSSTQPTNNGKGCFSTILMWLGVLGLMAAGVWAIMGKLL